MEPHVVIVIVAHNSGHRLAELLPQLGIGVAASYRVVVVDNGSTDGSVVYLRQHFPSVYVIETKAYVKYPQAINVGIQFALQNRATHVLLLSVHTAKVSVGWIDQLLEKKAPITAPVVAEDDAYVVGGLVTSTFSRPMVVRLAQKPPISFNTNPKFVSTAAVLITAKTFTKIGLFDEGYTERFFDIDFCLRAQIAGLRIAVQPKALVSMQNQVLSISLQAAIAQDYRLFLAVQRPQKPPLTNMWVTLTLWFMVFFFALRPTALYYEA